MEDMLDILLRLADPHVLQLRVVDDMQRPSEFARDRFRGHRLAGPGRAREEEAQPLRLLHHLLQAPAAVHETFVPQFRQGVEQALPRRLGEDEVPHREARYDDLRDGTGGLMDVRFGRLALVLRLVHFDAGIEEPDDPTNVVSGNVAARLADAPTLRALHDPFVPVLFPHPRSPEAPRPMMARQACSAELRGAI